MDEALLKEAAQALAARLKALLDASMTSQITLSRDEALLAQSCGSACKKDPLSGVIGVQKGPLISMV
jgi:hypothetical protein